jgi:hypothetical protein
MCITLRIGGFFISPSSGFQKVENPTFRKLDLFPSSGEDLRTETDPFSETLDSLLFGIQDDRQNPKSKSESHCD